MKVYCIQKIRLTLQADSILSKRDYDQAEKWAENVTKNRASWLELAISDSTEEATNLLRQELATILGVRFGSRTLEAFEFLVGESDVKGGLFCIPQTVTMKAIPLMEK